MAGRNPRLGWRTEGTLRKLMRKQGYDLLTQEQRGQLITICYAGYEPDDPFQYLSATTVGGRLGIKAQIAALPKREVR